MSDDDTDDLEWICRKLEKFDLRHHTCLQQSYDGHIEWWENEIASGKRCRLCWLTPMHCYCSSLGEISSHFKELIEDSSKKVQIIMYYHYLEIGRSANTAHLLDAICPSISKPLLFGDSDSEIQLFEEMKQEFLENMPCTCVLYPNGTATPLSEWLASRPIAARDKPIRFIALDGTYSHAQRQYKHLKKIFSLYGMPLPHVKLDLGDSGCKSMITGLMYQPSKVKICTFQAAVLALKQVGVPEEICDDLLLELKKWLEYMLTTKIKLGKSKLRIPLGLGASQSDDEETIEETI